VFEDAVKAGIPIIAVTYDDPVNLTEVLAWHARPRSTSPFPPAKSALLQSDRLYYTDDENQMSTENYSRLVKSGAQLIALNLSKPSAMAYDAGALPTPSVLIHKYLAQMQVPPDAINDLLQALRGCSLKTAQELTQLSAVVHGAITPRTVTAMRMKSAGGTPGLYPLDTEIGYWEPQAEIVDWMEINGPYMKVSSTPLLQPKGLMLSGPPGTGKSMAAKVIAKTLGVPAFRLDISTALNRYIGESEARMQRNLDLLLEYAPCVVLLDEVEKVFTTDQEQGTTSRMLSQLLWWLSDGRKVPCPVIMTTNKIEAIPPELYRNGRADMVVTIGPIHVKEARNLGIKVLQQLVPDPNLYQTHEVRKLFSDEQQHVPASVTERVTKLVKTRHWA
jgi:hypothetical protein